MTDMDDRLQTHLQALESGQSADEILMALPDQEAELAPLVRLAASMQSMSHPQMPVARIRAQRARLMETSMEAPENKTSRTGIGRAWMLPGLAGVALVTLCGLLALGMLAGGLGFFRQGDTQVAALTPAGGLVEVAGPQGDWSVVAETAELSPGDRVRTGSDGAARMEFSDGSTTELGPGTELTLESFESRRTARQVTLFQTMGSTTYQVTPAKRPGGSFVVKTPGGAAYVQGTTFDVQVSAQGASRFAVQEGRVRVVSGEEVVLLEAGQATAALPGQSPAPPAYGFSGQGRITHISGTTWTVGGLPITVIDQTERIGNFGVGDFVVVVGRLLDGDLWLADRMALAVGVRSFFQFTGPLEAQDSPSWQIAGVDLVVNESTEMKGDPQVGDLVEVTFTVLADGTRLALRIVAREDGSVEPDWGLVFEPRELAAEGCQDQFAFTSTLRNRGTLVQGVLLSTEVLQGAAYVEALNVSPMEIEQLVPGDQVPVEISLQLDPAFRQEPLGVIIFARVFVLDPESSSREAAELTITVRARCEVTPTPTPTMTPTPTPTPTPEPPTEGGKVTICHIPPGNPGNRHTITVGAPAVPAHLAHGDHLGPCQ